MRRIRYAKNKAAFAIIAAAMLMTTACSQDQTENGSSASVEQKDGSVETQTEITDEGLPEEIYDDTDAPEADSDEKDYEETENTEDGGHAITADGENASYDHVKVTKTGEAEGDEADFYGDNSAVFATNGGSLTLSNMDVKTDGTHANAVFCYGEGTRIDISDSVIETSGNCSGGIMTTGGGTMNAADLDIHTTGNSSAAIRSDRGGGTVTVKGGSYITEGTGSPAIYSTADITVSDAELVSTASQGIVVEGKNSVELDNVNVTADNNKKNSDKSEYYQAVMIYQSMSGDADQGTAEFTMNGGKLTNKNGDIFFVNNTSADINLKEADILNEGDGVFLRAAAAGWGREGSNGGHVTLTADDQTIDGDMLVDDISTLNLYLKEGSSLNGAINPEGSSGQVYVELTGGSKWTLTGDSHITSLTCDADSVDLNGYTLYIGNDTYEEGTKMDGDAVEVVVSEQQGGGQGERPEDAPDMGDANKDGAGKDFGNKDDADKGPGNRDDAGKEGPGGDPGNGGPGGSDGQNKPEGNPPEKPPEKPQ